MTLSMHGESFITSQVGWQGFGGGGGQREGVGWGGGNPCVSRKFMFASRLIGISFRKSRKHIIEREMNPLSMFKTFFYFF